MANDTDSSCKTQATVYFDVAEELEEVVAYGKKENRKCSNFILHCVRTYIEQKKKEESEAQ